MPRKPAKQVKSEIEEVRFFKWEFLRRNKDYQKDCDSFKKEDLGFYNDNPDATDEEYNKWVDEQYDCFYDKWYIDYPCDHGELKPRPFPKIAMDEAPVTVCNRAMKCRMGDMLILGSGKEVRIPQNMGLYISLDYPKKRIMASFESILDGAIKERQDRSIRHSHRTRLIEYPDYLKVWDFIQLHPIHPKKGWKWRAKKLYPKKYPEHEEETVHFLVEQYKACKKLIEGGYVTIR